MSTVAVVAHTGKSIGGGLPELRRVLAREGINDPLWYEVSKSRQAPKQVRRALARGAQVIFAWGGDGLAQRCIDTLAGTDATLAIVPAGTANLLASNLGIPGEIPAAVEVGLSGIRRRIDVGTVNGECFAVMAGVGFDARMIDAADGTLKDTLGRIAYLWTGARNLRAPSFTASVKVDGSSWYHGSASCILLANVGRLFAGIEIFEQSATRRRATRTGRSQRRRTGRVGPHDRPHRRRITRRLPLRPHNQRANRQNQTQPQGALRTRRRRPHKDTTAQDQNAARRGHDRRTRSRPDRTAHTTPRRRTLASRHTGVRVATRQEVRTHRRLCSEQSSATGLAHTRTASWRGRFPAR